MSDGMDTVQSVERCGDVTSAISYQLSEDAKRCPLPAARCSEQGRCVRYDAFTEFGRVIAAHAGERVDRQSHSSWFVPLSPERHRREIGCIRLGEDPVEWHHPHD